MAASNRSLRGRYALATWRRAKRLRRRFFRHLLIGVTLQGSVPMLASVAHAQLPTGPDVVAGAAAISQTGGTLDVNATTSRAIVNWDAFSVGAGNVANFNLPDANSAILNRVTGDSLSAINGALNSNGHVYLVNPNGIMVGNTGVINTNGFTASVFDVGNADFMAGGDLNFSGTSTSSIINEGLIETGAGGAHLIANEITNSGTITSVGGNITMAGGGEVTLSNGVTYVQPSLDTLTNGISPTAGFIKNEGVIRATGAATSGGDVYLVNPNGKILHDGTIAAQNVGPTSSLADIKGDTANGADRLEAYPTTGGHVQLEADEITLTENSVIDASGTNGGGEVLVGGDWQGGADDRLEAYPTMTQATSVTMQAGASIDASATEGGDGGKIVLWSDVTNFDSITKAFGTLVARAGDLFGNGGQIETSGAKIDTAGISVDAGAANGDGGHWLIDPYNYIIEAIQASSIVSALSGGTSVTVTTTADNASFGSSGDNANLGDIIVNSDIVTGAMSGDATLTLEAHRHINVDANIDATQNGNTAKLNVTLLADSDQSGDGINIVTGDSIKTNGGNLTFGDGSTATIGGSSVLVGGDVYISGTAAQSLETSGGTITVNGETIVANTSGITFDSGGGNIVLDGVLDSGNQYTRVDSTLSWEDAVAHAKSGTGDQLGDTYLATITSRLENAIAGLEVDYAQSWLGGRRVTGIGTDSSWRWVTGPEGLQDGGNGLIFAEQDAAGGATSVDGAFNNWNPNEPNNWTGSEPGDFGDENESAIQFVGAAGNWNDLPKTIRTLDQYVRETNLNPTGVTLDAGAGSVTINGGVGGGKELASLDVTSSATAIEGNSLITTGAQSFSSGLTVTSDFGVQVEATSLTAGGGVSITGTGGNVRVETSIDAIGDLNFVSGNDLIFYDQVVRSGNADTSSLFKADRHVVLRSDADLTTADGSQNIKLWADADANGDGIVTMLSDTIATSGGSLTVGNGDTATIGGSSVQVGGDIYISGTAAQSLETDGGDITINGETIVANLNGVSFDSDGGDIQFGGVLNSGNQYTYVDGPDGQTSSWDWARNDAKDGTGGGSNLGDSYLINITSRLENAIGGITADYRGAWIGAYRDTATPNDWKWADGPEGGQHFFTQAGGGGGSAESGWYSNFAAGEPNGTGTGGETRGQFFGNEGLWNDLSPSVTFSSTQDSDYAVLGYVRETNLNPTGVTIDAGTGSVTINGGAGGGKALSSLDITSSATTVNGDSLITTGAQNYSSALDVTSAIGLTVDATTLTTGGDLLLKAAGNIDVNADTSIVSNAGDITLWSDSDNSGQGYILLREDATLDSRTSADRTAMTHTTGGGAIILGGGTDDGNGAPGGYATAVSSDTDRGGVNLGDQTASGQTNETQIFSGGGDITIRGRSTHGMMGINWVNSGTIDAGSTGLINLDGVNTSTGHGIEFGSWNGGGVTTLLRSGAGAGAIDISGTTSATNGANGLQAQNLFVEATGTDGSINLTGVTGTGGYGVIGNLDLLAASGPIKVDGGTEGVSISSGTFGRKAGSSVTTSSSDIEFVGDRVAFAGTSDIATSGEVTIEPSGTSFDSALSWPMSNLTVSSDITGLTLGKDGNTADVTVGTAINIAGPISIYGGSIGLDADMTSTATTGTGISLNGTAIVQSAGVDVSTSGADIEYVVAEAGFTAGNDRPFELSGTSGSLVTIDASGGDISLSSSFGTTGVAGDTDRAIAVSFAEVKTSGTGTITIVGDATNNTSTGNVWGFQGNDILIQTESGAIDITTTGGKASANSRGLAVDGQGFKVLSESGAITIQDLQPTGLTGNYGGLYLRPNSSSEIVIGADGSNVASSTSDILIQADKVQFDNTGSFGTTFNTSGDVVLESSSSTFAAAADLSDLTVSGGPSSLRVGKSTNTADITIGSDISVAGPISIYGGDVDLNANLTSTQANADVLLKAVGDINLDTNVDIATNGGDVTLWSDSDDSGAGYILFDSGATILTGGGDIVLGGGLDANSDGIPDGDAIGSAMQTPGSGVYWGGVSLNRNTLDTRVAGTLDATAGDISINGTSSHTGANLAVGTLLYQTKLIGNDVDVTGSVTDTGGTTTRYGISSNGDVAPNNTQIQAYGDITLTCNAATPADQWSIRWGTNHEMTTVDGDIAINSNGQLKYLSSQTLTLAENRSLVFNSDFDAEWRNVIAGAGGLTKTGTGELVLSQQNTYTGATNIDAGDLIIRRDAPDINTSQFNGPGTLTIESSAASFSSPLNVTAKIDGVSSLTVGKSTNTADVTLGDDVAVAGPINVYGGTLSFDGTVAAGSGDISLVGNDLVLSDTVSSTGAFSIQTQTAGTSIGVGTGAGDLHVSLAELGLLQDGFSSVTIGDTAAGELQVGGITAINNDVTLRAGSSSDQLVTDALSWSSDDALTLAAGGDIWVNGDINVGGSNASLNLLYGGTDGTTAPTAGKNFYIDLAGRHTINFADKAASLKIGNTDFTLIDSVSDFTGMTASGNYALANGLDLSGTTYTDAVYTSTFTGNLEGLGHSADGMVIRDNDGGNLGLFAQLDGASVRHLGVTNFDIKTDSVTSGASGVEYRVGGLVGNVGGAGTSVSSVTTLDGVWSSGVISTEQGSEQKFFFGGGLVGSQNGGFMDMTRSYSTANVSTDGSYTDNLATGGLVGDIGTNTDLTTHTPTTSSVVDYSISNSYATGSIVQGSKGAYFGSGGLVGVIYTSGGELTDNYSWSNVVGTESFGGLAGYAQTGTYQRNYTTQASVGSANLVNSTNYNGIGLMITTSSGATLPPGWSSAVWAVGSEPTLNSLPVPQSLLFVKVGTGATSIYGDSLNIGYSIVDSTGSAVTFGSGDYTNLSGTTGSGVFTIGEGANADTYSSVSYLAGLTLTGDDANDYVLNPFSTSGSYTVTPRSITAALNNTGASKVYDGNTNYGAGFTPTYTVNNILDGDAVTFNFSTLLYNSEDVASANIMNLTGLSLAGITGSNGSLFSDYVLTNTTTSVAATITPKPIVIENVFASDKIYDGTTSVTIDASGATFTGLVSGDSLTLGSISAAFADKNAGTDKTVNVSGVIGGADVANYTGSGGSTTTADITQKAVTVSGITGESRVYDATTDGIIDASGATFTGIVSGDTLTFDGATGTFADKNVGTGKTITITSSTYGGADVGNYSFTDQTSTTGDITAKSLTVDLGAYTGKVYDGTTSVDLSGVTPTLTGIISGDTVTIGSGTVTGFADKNVGTNKAVDFTGFSIAGADAANYDVGLGSAESTAAITAKSITVSGITGVDRVYDGTTSATLDHSGVTFSGMISGDNLSASGSSGVFDDKNVGTDKTLTLSGTTYGGTDAGNYAFTDQATTTADVTAKSVTVSGITASDRVYDGTTSVTLDESGAAFTGIVSGDDLTISGTTGSFADKNAGTDKTVTLAGSTYGGADVGNYTFTDQANTTADITQKAITVGGLVANDLVYDGTTNATVDHSGVSFTGIVSGDNLTASGTTGQFADKNVAASKAVTLSGTTYGGTDVSNYTFTDQTSSSADITAKAISVSGLAANDRVYDGSTTAIVDHSGVTFNGMVAGDTLTAASTTGAFADKNVGSDKAVTLSGTTYGGTDVGNYTITDQASSTADITPKAITVSGLAANDRIYDGTTTATVDHTGVTFTGIVSGDNLTAASTTGAFADKNVGTDKTVTLSGTTYGGTDLNNYTFTDQASSTADVTPKAITATGITAANKVYDGTTTSTVDHSGVTFTGMVAGDTLTAADTTGTFDNKNVGTGKTVTLSGTSYGGADVDNYTITDQATANGSVTNKALTLNNFAAADKVYDGTTNVAITSYGTLQGVIAGDTVDMTSTTGGFGDKNVGSSKTVTLSGISLGGVDGGNYSINSTATTLADVTAKSLSVSGLVVADKVYDTTTNATVTNNGSLVGIVSGDTVNITGSTATFADKNVGTGKSVATTSISIAGADSGNYVVDQATTTANVTPATLQVTGLTGDNKVYDGTTNATVSGTATISPLGTDAVSLAGTPAFAFADKNVASGISVNIDGYALTGADAFNYVVAQPTTTADITPAPLTVTANNDAKFVTKTDVSGFAGARYDGFVQGEDSSVLGGSLAIARVGAGTDEAAGTYADALAASGLTSTNYDLAFETGDFTITPADELLIRFGSSSDHHTGTNAFSFLSAEYMNSGNVVSALSAPTVTGNQFTFNDGANGSAVVTIGASGATTSTGGFLNIGSYTLEATNVSESHANFGNSVTITGSHTVTRTELTPTLSGANKTYDGTTSVFGQTLGTTGVGTSDLVTIGGIGAFDSKNAGTGLGYSVSNLALSGADANNYFLGNASVTATDGVITPKAVTLTAPTVTKTYDGNTNGDATQTQLAQLNTELGVAGDYVNSVTLTYDNKNVGTGKTLTPSTANIVDGNGGGNYSVTYQDSATSSVTRLDSVTWIGGPTGDWSDPNNWAGGAIPDLANVANVIIPEGSTPTFNSSVPGPVELDSISGGNLTQDSGSLGVDGDVSLTDYTQNSGDLNIGGDLTTTRGFQQSPGGTLDVGGAADITNSSGDLTVHSLNAGTATLNSPNGGVVLGDVATTGDLTANAGNGDVTQTPTSDVTVGGESTLQATGDVVLDGANNDFQGSVNAIADNVTLRDSAGDIELGDIATTGDLEVTADDGDVAQDDDCEISAGGETTVSADGDVDLSSGTNSFAGPVNLDATNAEVTQSTGDLTLGTVNTTGNLSVDAPGGDILQTPTGTIDAGGNATLLTGGTVNLPGSNSFAGSVTTDALTFNVNSLVPYTTILTGPALGGSTQAIATVTYDTFARYGLGDQGEGTTALPSVVEVAGILVEEFTGWTTRISTGWLESVDVSNDGSDVYIKRKKRGVSKEVS